MFKLAPQQGRNTPTSQIGGTTLILLGGLFSKKLLDSSSRFPTLVFLLSLMKLLPANVQPKPLPKGFFTPPKGYVFIGKGSPSYKILGGLDVYITDGAGKGWETLAGANLKSESLYYAVEETLIAPKQLQSAQKKLAQKERKIVKLKLELEGAEKEIAQIRADLAAKAFNVGDIFRTLTGSALYIVGAVRGNHVESLCGQFTSYNIGNLVKLSKEEALKYLINGSGLQIGDEVTAPGWECEKIVKFSIGLASPEPNFSSFSREKLSEKRPFLIVHGLSWNMPLTNGVKKLSIPTVGSTHNGLEVDSVDNNYVYLRARKSDFLA